MRCFRQPTFGWPLAACLAIGTGGCSAGAGEDDPARNRADVSVGGGSTGGSDSEQPDAGEGVIIPPPSGGGGSSSDDPKNDDVCEPVVVGLLRDFSPLNHPDFESDSVGAEKGLVETLIGPNRKPVLASGGHKTVTSSERFQQWYRDTPGINTTVVYELELERDEKTGRAVFDSSAFFPLDGNGFGNEGNDHNYHFTFELHMQFDFRGDEVFTFRGDDDVFVFINDILVIDLGGVHPPEEDTIDLASLAEPLGLVPGNTYPIDFFHAERHKWQSNFRIESTLSFSNCDPILIR